MSQSPGAVGDPIPAHGNESEADVFRFENFDPGQVLHGIMGRAGGASERPFDSLNLSIKTGDDRERVGENRRRFERALGFESRQAAFGRLNHGSEVTVFKLDGLLPAMTPPDLGWPMFDTDAAISNVPGLVLIMTFADCVPIQLWDGRAGACGLAHAGWRGTALRIGSKKVAAMTDAFDCDPTDIRASIGPSIGPECYPVGDEVRSAFEAGFGNEASRCFREDHLDLWSANRTDLISAGVQPNHIEVAGICTACHTDRFFSHRGEGGKTGRFGGCIGLRYPGRFGSP